MIEFDKYFLTECNIFLHHVDYDHLSMGGEPKLTITDQIGAYDVAEDKVRIEISRSVNAAPGQLFSLRVVFGVLLTKNPLVMGELDWSQVNVAEEFKKAKKPLINNVVSRISLLISSLTSSSGVVPVITPPQLIGQ